MLSTDQQSSNNKKLLWAYNLNYFNRENYKNNDGSYNDLDWLLESIGPTNASYTINDAQAAILLAREDDNVPRLTDVTLNLNNDWFAKSTWQRGGEYEVNADMALNLVEKYYTNKNYQYSIHSIINDLESKTNRIIESSPQLRRLLDANYSSLMYDNNLSINPPDPYIEMPLNRIFSHSLYNQEQFVGDDEDNQFLNPFPLGPKQNKNDLYIDYLAAVEASLSADARLLWSSSNLVDLKFPIYQNNGKFFTGISIDRDNPVIQNSDSALKNMDLLFVKGGPGSDSLQASPPGSILIGGHGKDILTGGQGDDIFSYFHEEDSRAGDSERDVLVNFNSSGSDKIDLSVIDADSLQPGHQNFVYIATDHFSNSPGEIRLQDNILEINLDYDASPEMQLEISNLSTFQPHYLIL
jgi:hypothetical protein